MSKKIEEFDFYPLEGQPYFNNDRFWVSPMNFLEENISNYPDKIQIHDSTLRDGEQTPRVSYLKSERIRIAEQLNKLGVDRIEIGMPIISEDLRDAIKDVMRRDFTSKVVSFARAHPDDVRLTIECGVRDIIVEHCVNPYLCKYAYNLTPDDLLKRVSTHVDMAVKAGLWVNFMGWDFTRTPLEFSRKIYQAAVDAGANALTVVDTFAVATPKAIGFIFRKMSEWFPGVQLEFHVHNDFGTGMGAAMAAVENGATVLHTAMNALGERTGNLATEEVATTFELLLGGRTNVNLELLNETAELISDITGIYPNVNKTVFGKNCFGIESGVVSHYAEGMQKKGINPAAIPYLPHVVGREAHDYFIGYLSGRLTVDHYLEKYGLNATNEQREAVLEAVKAECLVRKALLPEASFVKLAKCVLEEKR